MNRRLFVSTFAIAPFAFQLKPTFAQEAEATPDVFRFEYDNRLVTAARNFESAGLRLVGGMKYSMGVDIFENRKAAEKAFKQASDYIDGYLEETTAALGSEVEVGERQEMSAPKLGDKRMAEAVTVSSEGIDFSFVFFFAQEDEIMHRWMGVGLSNPAEEFFGIADEHMKFDDVDPEKEDEVFSLVPELDDMPEGFLLSDSGELFERDNDEE